MRSGGRPINQPEEVFMAIPTQAHNLRLEWDFKNCEVGQEELDKMTDELDTLGRMIEKFPVADLYVTLIRQARSGDVHVKTSLILPGRILFTGEKGTATYQCFRACTRKLVRKVQAYEADLNRDDEHSRHADQARTDVHPETVPDEARLHEAVRGNDFFTFRELMAPYDGPLRERASKALSGYPQLEDAVNRETLLNDIRDEVFLDAFESFEQKPQEVRLGLWLEQLIDDAIEHLVSDPDDETANIDMMRTAMEALDEERRSDGQSPK
jgi:hypothetical protein